jgi:hypothetical protein
MPTRLSAALLSLCLLTSAHAGVVALTPSIDNSIYEPDLSNGEGEFLFSGRTGSLASNALRRCLVLFDLSSIPAGAVITSATLEMEVDLPLGNITGTHDFTLHRLIEEWGEGPSDAGDPGGGGVAPQPGDASWTNAISPGTPWCTPGGAFDAPASASTTVSGDGTYLWSSTTLVSDVQAWIDGSTPNYGWILIGNESVNQSAKRFSSREGDTPPVLTIDFSVSTVPTMSEWGLITLAILTLGLGGVIITRRRVAFTA